MMSIATIHEMSRKAARKAAREHKIPFMVEAEDMGHIENVLHGIPYIGTYVPKGYKRVDSYFVDSSGFGSESEPAMTFGAFCKKVRERGPGYAYAITEVGQFQVYVGVYVKGGNKKLN